MKMVREARPKVHRVGSRCVLETSLPCGHVKHVQVG
jgi:hypothetical protein